MTMRRHYFVAFLLIAAVVSVFFSPLVPVHGTAGRHPHSRTNLATAPAVAAFSFAVASAFPSPPSSTEARASRSENLIALHCAWLC